MVLYYILYKLYHYKKKTDSKRELRNVIQKNHSVIPRGILYIKLLLLKCTPTIMPRLQIFSLLMMVLRSLIFLIHPYYNETTGLWCKSSSSNSSPYFFFFTVWNALSLFFFYAWERTASHVKSRMEILKLENCHRSNIKM